MPYYVQVTMLAIRDNREENDPGDRGVPEICQRILCPDTWGLEAGSQTQIIPWLDLSFGSWAKLRRPVIPVLERQRKKGQQFRIILIYIVSLGLTCATRDSTNKQTKILQNLSYTGVPGQLKARPYCKHINRQADSMKWAAATIFSSFFTSHTGSCCS